MINWATTTIWVSNNTYRESNRGKAILYIVFVKSDKTQLHLSSYLSVIIFSGTWQLSTFEQLASFEQWQPDTAVLKTSITVHTISAKRCCENTFCSFKLEENDLQDCITEAIEAVTVAGIG